jgi:hypothetical protein
VQLEPVLIAFIAFMAKWCELVLLPCACRGSALLVGVGGSGKQSLARFAAMVADCDVSAANVRQGYGLAAFREDVKQLYRVGCRC